MDKHSDPDPGKTNPEESRNEARSTDTDHLGDKRQFATISDTEDLQNPILPGEVPQIEGYQITGKLGEGGMGTVWRAVQLGTRREVALKLLGSGVFGSDKARMRFEREVELAARLEHPNIARVYESGLHHNVHYYAMELIDGVHLDEYVETNDLSHRQILELVQNVADAVQHAHQRGVIHRDLKPSNIVVTGDGNPHVLDFGLAKTLLDEDTAVTISMPGEVAGTPAYMSPEQAAGHLDQIDTRTDVYSLGVILYRLLIRQYPHELSGTRYEVLRRIAEEEAKRPRDASKKIDKELEALLLKALAHESSHRYASAGDLAADINNYLTGEPLTAKAPTTMYFLRKRLRKYRMPVAIASAVLAALIGMAVYSYVNVTWERDRAVIAENDASQQRDVSRKEATRADAEAQKTKQEAERNRRALYLARISLAAGEHAECNDSAAKRLLDACPEDLRKWEWGYLSKNLDGAFVGLDHKNVTWASFSPDGSRLATLSGDRTMCLWEARSGRRIWSSAIGAGTPAVFTPGGKTILASSAEGSLLELDVSTGKLKSTIKNVPSESGASLVVSPDGKLIALAGDKVIHVLDKRKGENLLDVKWLGSHSDLIVFSKDSVKVSAVSVGKNLWVEWNVRTGEKTRTGELGGQARNEHILAISPDLTQMAMITAPGIGDTSIPAIVVREITSRRHVCDILDYEPGPFGRSVFSVDGKRLLVEGAWAIKGYDVRTGRRLFRMRKSEFKLRMGADLSKKTPAVDLEVQHILSGPQCRSTVLIIDRKAYLVRTGRGYEHMDIKAMNVPLFMVKFSPGDRTLAALGISERPKIRFWNMDSRDDTWTINAGDPRSPNIPVIFTPDGQSILAMSTAFGGLAKIDVKSGRVIGGYKMDSRPSRDFNFIGIWIDTHRAVSYAPGGKELVWGLTNGECYVWDAASGQKLRTIKGADKASFVCSNGVLGVVGDSLFGRGRRTDKRGRAKVVSLVSGETICSLSEQVRLPLTISKDGRWVFAMMNNWTMGVVSAKTGKVQSVLSGVSVPAENRGGMAVLASPLGLNAFSPDGERIITGGAGGRVHLWDTRSGTRVLSLDLGRMVAMRLTFSPGGKYIAAGLGDGRIRLWAGGVAYNKVGEYKHLASKSEDKTIKLAKPAVVPGGAADLGTNKKPDVGETTIVVPTHQVGTVAQYAQLTGSRLLPVRGYGIVGALGKNGSSQIPPELKNYLVQYLRRRDTGSRKAGRGSVQPERILRDMDTAIVEISGSIPSCAPKGKIFDVQIRAIGSQVRSLGGGVLYQAELRLATGNVTAPDRGSKILATASGAIFVNPFIDETKVDELVKLRDGRVIGGGKVVESRPIRLQLLRPDLTRSLVIQRSINERFQRQGMPRVASAKGSDAVSITIPPEWHNDYLHFLDLVMHLSLQTAGGQWEKRARQIARAMVLPKANHDELSLVWEAMGRRAIPIISTHYTNADPSISYYSARAGMRLGDMNAAPKVILRAAGSPGSPLRNEAIQELGRHPRYTQGLSILRKTLDDPDDMVRVTAYESLRKIGRNAAVMTIPVGEFYLDIVNSKRQGVIYATQSEDSRIVLFGGDMAVMRPVNFIGPQDLLTVNASGKDEHITMFRKVGASGRVSPAFTVAPKVKSLIRAMGDRVHSGQGALMIPDLDLQGKPKRDNEGKVVYKRARIKGLGLSYGQVVAILHRLCKQGLLVSGETSSPCKFVLQKRLVSGKLDKTIKLRDAFDRIKSSEQPTREKQKK